MSTWLTLPSMESLKRRVLCDPQHAVFELISFEGSREFVEKNNVQTWILLVLALWVDRWMPALR